MRTHTLAALIAASSVFSACTARADARYALPGSMVDLQLRVDGRPAPLYPAPDGSGRLYLEARRGARYEIDVRNRTNSRLGVLLAVDGLNVVSGEREVVRPGAQPGRMYVLGPWDDVTVRGWRQSMQDVRSFTFVDEQASYAARTDKANSKMGWIELVVYRERARPQVYQPYRPWLREDAPGEREERDRDGRAAGDAPAAAAEAPRSARKSAEGSDSAKSLGYADGAEPAPAAPTRRESFAGTGWGERQSDPVVTVQFEPEPYPAETMTLRYEYRSALVRLGILPQRPYRDRLAERESGRDGFAKPPAW